MTDATDIRSRPLPERVALLGLADLADRDRTPSHAFEVKEVCVDHLDDADEAVGRPSEAEVVRALNRLETTELVEQTDADATESTVGKGRPAYELAVDPGTVLASLADDDRTGEMVERVRSG